MTALALRAAAAEGRWEEDWRSRAAALEDELRGQRAEGEALRRLVQDITLELTHHFAEFRALKDCLAPMEQPLPQPPLPQPPLQRPMPRPCPQPTMTHLPLPTHLPAVPEEDVLPDTGRLSARLAHLEQEVASISLRHGITSLQRRHGLPQAASAGGPAAPAPPAWAPQPEPQEALKGRELLEVLSSVEQVHARLVACEATCASVAGCREQVQRLERRLGEEDAQAPPGTPNTSVTEEEGDDSVASSRLRWAPEAMAMDSARRGDRQNALLLERLEGLERHAAERAEEQGECLRGLRGQIDALNERVLACELRGSCGPQPPKGSGTFAEEQHVSQLLTLRSAHAKLAGELQERHAELKEAIMQERLVTQDLRSAVETQFDTLEEQVRDCRCEQDKSLAGIRSDHAKLMGEVKARDLRFASICDRISVLEESGTVNEEENARQARTTSNSLEQIHRRLAEERLCREQQHAFVRDLFTKEKEERVADRAVLSERFEHLGRCSSEDEGWRRLGCEVKSLQMAQGKLTEEVQALGFKCAAASEHLQGLAGKAAEPPPQRHSEEALEQCQRGLRVLEASQSSQSRSAMELSDRVALLERAFGAAEASNGRELRAAQAKLEKLQGRWAKVREVWHKDLEPMEGTFSDACSGSASHVGGWDTSSQCGSWASEEPFSVHEPLITIPPVPLALASPAPTDLS